MTPLKERALCWQLLGGGGNSLIDNKNKNDYLRDHK